MASRNKQEFAQEAFATPFTTVLLSKLEYALFAKKLHNRIPREPRRRKVRSGWLGDGPYTWVRRASHRLIREAKQWATEQIRSDLQKGHLIAHMPTEIAGVFVRIPPEFWQERRSGIRYNGMLFDLDKNILVPDEIYENTFCVLEEGARSWLAQRQIKDSNPAYPKTLRKHSSTTHSRKNSGRPPSTIGNWCVNTGLVILTERGGISPNFRQVHLIHEIFKRRPEHWMDEEPSEASMKRYAGKAIKQFENGARKNQ